MHTDVRHSTRAETPESLVTAMQASRLHDFLKGRRERIGLLQIEVAERLDLTPRQYGNWERGLVKEWTDKKLYNLAEALEMSEYQLTLLFYYAVQRAPQPGWRATRWRTQAGVPGAAAFLDHYAVMMDALSLPTFVIDRCWDVKMTNAAYRNLFRNVRAHPTAMPSRNFLRFGLFHPDAPSILVDHLKWQLAMLAQLSSSLERNAGDNELQAIRREVYRSPMLRDAYLNEMPTWVMGSGADLVHQSAVCELRHPDPQIGLQGCRPVEETPRSLQALGLMRLTLVLVDPDGNTIAESRASHDHHRA